MTVWKDRHTLSQQRVPFNNILIQDQNKFNLLNILTSLYKKKGTLLSQERVPFKLIVYKVVEKNRFFRGNFSDGRRFFFFSVCNQQKKTFFFSFF
jgi:hypothetical protein